MSCAWRSARCCCRLAFSASYSPMAMRTNCAWVSATSTGVPGGGTKRARPPFKYAMSASLRARIISADISCCALCVSSAVLIVGSSSTSNCPFFTCWPFLTWIARIEPISIGWIILLLADGTIFPVAVATTSTLPMNDQSKIIANRLHRISISHLRPGLGGFSIISSAAGRNS